MTIAKAIRWLLAFATLLVVVWSFVVVGARTWQQARPTPHQTHLTMIHWGDPREVSIVQKLIAQYRLNHPNIEIEDINVDAANYRTKLATMFAAGTPPDIFYLPPDILPTWANQKLVRPIDDYLDAERRSGHGQWINDFYPVLMDAFRYDTKRQRVGSGPLYGLPKDFQTSIFYVNLDLFKAANLRVPYGGWSWDEFAADMKKISALSGKPGFEGRRIYGGVFLFWDSTFRSMLHSFGGDFFGPDGFRDVALDSPQCREAMQFLRKLWFTDQSVYNPTGIARDSNEEFLDGDIGCLGPIGRWEVPTYATSTTLHWDIVPMPYKTPQTATSELFTNAWAISAGSKHPDASFALAKFLCGPTGAAMGSRLGLAIPPLKSVANSADFLSPPGLPPIHEEIMLQAIPRIQLDQNPIDQEEFNRIINDYVLKDLTLGRDPMELARGAQKQWLDVIDSPLLRQTWKPFRWERVSWIAAIFIALSAGTLWWRARREKLGFIDRAQERAGWAFISLWVFGFLGLTLGPMVVSLLLSFTQWTGMNPLSTALSVGAANYRQLLTNDAAFYKSLQVTCYFVILAVPIGQIAALAVALLMNLKVRGITVFRTIYFVPSVVSGVALAVLWRQIFNNQYGLLNKALRPIASLLHTVPPDWFGKDAHRWAIPAFVIMGLWGVGGGMIIYLAGLKGIPASLYEAATIDGAGPLTRLWRVTLPMLSPLIFYNLVMGIIGSFQIFTQAYVMNNNGGEVTGGPDNSMLFYVLNLYLEAFSYHKMGYASALAWVLFVIILLLTIAVFRASRNLVYYEGLKA